MFEQWINNDLTQSLLLSPLMGVLFGVLFAGLTKSVDEQSPKTIVRTREVYRERVIYRQSNRTKSSGNDGGILIAAGLGLIILIWQYAIWADQVYLYLSFLVSCVLSFSITTALISVWKGHFTSQEWWIYVIFPQLFLAFSMYLLNQVNFRFDPELSQLARETSWFNFYFKSLSDYGRNFMITHVIGVAVLSLLIIVTTVIELHYLSLMNQRTIGVMQGFWSSAVRFTGPLSGTKGIVISTFLAISSFLLINEHVAAWMTK